MSYSPMHECLACGGRQLICYLDLGAQPPANLYHDGQAVPEEYPLAVNFCLECTHSQLTVAVDPRLLFEHYRYVSGTTKTLRDYFRWFADFVEAERGNGSALAVLDIASNDGSLLAEFKSRGHVVQGVDPARNLSELAASHGVPTWPGFWGAEAAAAMPRKFDVVVAMNVLAHVADPLTFLTHVRTALTDTGVLYVQTSQCDMFEHGEFDTIYHEHHSFFTAASFGALCRRAGLKVVACRRVPIHGTSYLWTLSQGGGEDESVAAEMKRQADLGMGRVETYLHFGEVARSRVQEVRTLVEEHRSRGYGTIGYGAAAKGQTFLNFGRIKLDYIIDDNPLKTGLFTPGLNIPIVSSDVLRGEHRPLSIVIPAWNFFDEIVGRIKVIGRNYRDTAIRYFPTPEALAV